MALPAPPGPRMPYDRDGSIFFTADNGGNYSAYSVAQMRVVNNETGGQANPKPGVGVGGGNCLIGIAFPQQRDVVGYFLCGLDGGGSYVLETSTDTTNGTDGSWTGHGAPIWSGSTVCSPTYRTSFHTVSFLGVTGMRFHGDCTFATLSNVHVYGQVSAGQNPDSLRLWDPVSMVEFTEDFGNMPQGPGSVAVKQFLVHNQSSGRRAFNIILYIEALSDASPSLIGQYQLSTDGVTYANSVSIPDLAPGATSAPIYIRDTVNPSTTMAAWACRILATTQMA